jgi:hypothetical protein
VPAFLEAEGLESAVEPRVPSVWSLMDIIELLAKSKYLVFLLDYGESGRLRYIHLLVEHPIQERGHGVHVVHVPNIVSS